MKLYKNVDIVDLKSIMNDGVLSLDACKNNNWDEGKRANTATDVVYLFSPIAGKQNSFPQYGTALLEIETTARRHEISDTDWNRGKYIEYVCDKVKPDEIKHIYIPEIFKDISEEYVDDNMPIIWCDMKANLYNKTECDAETLQMFAETAHVVSTTSFNFFRGVNEKREMIDLYDIHYVID